MAAVTDDRGGRHSDSARPRLDSTTHTKAALRTSRWTIDWQIERGMRSGTPVRIVAAGEGVETVLSLRRTFPALPMIANLPAARLRVLGLPLGTRHLLIARNCHPAGQRVTAG